MNKHRYRKTKLKAWLLMDGPEFRFNQWQLKRVADKCGISLVLASNLYMCKEFCKPITQPHYDPGKTITFTINFEVPK